MHDKCCIPLEDYGASHLRKEHDTDANMSPVFGGPSVVYPFTNTFEPYGTKGKR